MSSIIEKSETQPLKAASFFFRSNSIEKIKCTAVYPFQVAGLKLSKGAIIELLETNIIKARVVTQKAQLNVYIAFLKLVSTLLSPLIGASDSSVDENCDNKNTTAPKSIPKKSFNERLHEKLVRLEKHKSRFDCKKETFISTVPCCNNNVKSTEDLNKIANDIVDRSQQNGLIPLAAAKKDLIAKTGEVATNKFQKLCLILCVHLGLVFMYLQIFILAIALNTTNIPFGLVFMIATTGFIGYIIFKIFIVEPCNKNKSRKLSKSPSPLEMGPDRQSRPKIRNVIDFNSKTLSKVKLL